MVLAVVGLFVAVVMYTNWSDRRQAHHEAASARASYAKEQGGWEKGYGYTTCSDWTAKMTTGEQFTAADNLLYSNWYNDQRTVYGDDVPPTKLSADFTDAISAQCSLKANAAQRIPGLADEIIYADSAKWREGG